MHQIIANNRCSNFFLISYLTFYFGRPNFLKSFPSFQDNIWIMDDPFPLILGIFPYIFVMDGADFCETYCSNVVNIETAVKKKLLPV